MLTNDAHAARISALLENRDTQQIESIVAPLAIQSWRRCHDHGLNPLRFCKLPVVTNRELLDARDELDENLLIAKEELDSLFNVVRSIGYSTGLANRNGVILLDSADYQADTWCEFDRPGSIWTEEFGGTNGVGTCLHTKKFVTVFQHEHYFSDLTPMACVAAPLYNDKCEFWGVMNISIKQAELKHETHQLASLITRQYAERLSNRIFKRTFRENSILQFKTPDDQAGLVALGDDQIILGANSAARQLLGIHAEVLGKATLWKYFVRNTQSFRSAESEGRPAQFELKDSGSSINGYVQHVPKVINARATSERVKAVASAAKRSEMIGLDEWAGNDKTLRQNVTVLRRVLKADLPILILGETGVGKDTLARAVHAESRRAAGPFVAFNCAAVPETLIDSELFGYTSGAFTGASREGNPGRVVEADGGTLFLDEIGDMPMSLQTRLLRLLETREVLPLGSGRARKVDVQVIAATNQHLEQAVKAKQFRQDLYYRLAGVVVDVPALRERSDLEQLIDHILTGIKGEQLRLSPAALDRLLRHTWPGNIRELGHVLNRAVAIATDGVITVNDLMLRPVEREARPATPRPVAAGSAAGPDRERIVAAIREAAGDIQSAAGLLGVSRATLYRKVSQFGIDLKSLIPQ